MIAGASCAPIPATPDDEMLRALEARRAALHTETNSLDR